MNETQDMLRQAFQTRNQLTIPISATGMAGMEACLVNLLEPSDKVVVCAKGFFGQRMVDIAGRTGAQVTVLEAPWGGVFDLDRLRDTLKSVRPKVLSIVHAETSTGAWQPIEQLGKLCHEFDTLLVVDAVTSLGCIPLAVDAWELDAVFSCTQKGLSCPPGLSPVTFSPRAVEAIGKRKTKVQSWYFDMSTIQKYWGGDRHYHHTAPITGLYAIREGLRILLEEGLEARWQRHLLHHRALKAGLTALGLEYTAGAGHQLPQLNAVRLPAGVDDVAGRKLLLERFGIEVGGGLGDLKGKAWRIGIMGHNARAGCVLLVLGALELVLQAQGVKVQLGAGVAAANGVYASA
jgi:alanine-glyoxylate transaminase/serine-glyoxylate transaminase/serine-pyruvate transaminase